MSAMAFDDARVEAFVDSFQEAPEEQTVAQTVATAAVGGRWRQALEVRGGVEGGDEKRLHLSNWQQGVGEGRELRW